ncbi:uncharacterized protein LOC115926596 [Strongylocentrotus purpuratus]|uniref:C3H1-type domain-containing protein n=1 Tax=Strongylocentrotus purpuratus TaxID=7668 RepID=A0A7M7P9Y3_STRPU|nr:uncharacterized protein LOC115926596 [Strongylocentrotus purpuratus]
MTSLVADYPSSSGSDSDSEADIPINRQEKESKTRHNLLTSQDTSSSSDSDSNAYSSDRSRKSSVRKSVKADKDNVPLPLPQGFSSSEPLGGTGNAKNLLSLSVFANPFEQARQDQLSILEKHVKMKEQEKPDGAAAARGNHKMCYKFQKGNCRFGDTCKFSHGSDHKPVLLTGGNSEAYPSAASGGHMGAPFQDDLYDEGQRAKEEEETIRKRRKDRAGLSEALVPSKKAKRIYDRQRTQERPWTAKR